MPCCVCTTSSTSHCQKAQIKEFRWFWKHQPSSITFPSGGPANLTGVVNRFCFRYYPQLSLLRIIAATHSQARAHISAGRNRRRGLSRDVMKGRRRDARLEMLSHIQPCVLHARRQSLSASDARCMCTGNLGRAL